MVGGGLQTTMMSAKPSEEVAKGGRCGWFAEGRFRHRSLSPTAPSRSHQKTAEPTTRNASLFEYVPPPVEVTLEEAKKILKLTQRPASPAPTASSTISSAPSPQTPEKNEAASSPKKGVVLIELNEPTRWFSRRRATRSHSSQALQVSSPPRPSPPQKTLSPPPQQQQQQQPPSPLPLQRVSTTTSQTLVLTNVTSIPEFLSICEIVEERPPPALMDDATSVASASSSTITFSIDQRSLVDHEDDDEEDEELRTIAAKAAAEPVTLDDPVMQTGWWERLWEMVDPEDDHGTVVTHHSDVESEKDDVKEPPASMPEAVPSPALKARWWKARRLAQREEQAAPIRPPSRCVFDDEDDIVAKCIGTIPNECKPMENPMIVFTKDDDDDEEEEIEKAITNSAYCTFCGLERSIAPPIMITTTVGSEPNETLPTSEVPAEAKTTKNEPAESRPLKKTSLESEHSKKTPVEPATTKKAPAEKAPAEPARTTAVEPVTIKKTPEESKTIKKPPALSATIKKASVEPVPVKKTALAPPATIKKTLEESEATKKRQAKEETIKQKSAKDEPLQKETAIGLSPAEKESSVEKPIQEEPDAAGSNDEAMNDEEVDGIADHFSVILSKLDRKLFPWFCRAEEEQIVEAAKDASSSDGNVRKVRFAADVKDNEEEEDDDDDGIVEKVEAKEPAEADKPKETVEQNPFAKFFDWLVAVETSAASLSDTNDALCQPIKKLAESENPGPVFSFVIDPKIPLEINMMTCNFDDSTVLTMDPAFLACGGLRRKTEEAKWPKPFSKPFFRRTGRTGKVLPVMGPPFLRKAPVNRDREKHELEIARAMWRHYKKSKDIKENINDIRRAAERQRQREEWAAAVAAHRRLRQCNHLNCQCHQERW